MGNSVSRDPWNRCYSNNISWRAPKYCEIWDDASIPGGASLIATINANGAMAHAGGGTTDVSITPAHATAAAGEQVWQAV